MNIIINGEFPLRSQGRMLALTAPIQLGARHSSQCNKAGKGKRRHMGQEEEIKLSLLADDMMVYMKNPKESTTPLPTTSN